MKVFEIRVALEVPVDEIEPLPEDTEEDLVYRAVLKVKPHLEELLDRSPLVHYHILLARDGRLARRCSTA